MFTHKNLLHLVEMIFGTKEMRQRGAKEGSHPVWFRNEAEERKKDVEPAVFPILSTSSLPPLPISPCLNPPPPLLCPTPSPLLLHLTHFPMISLYNEPSV